MAITKRKSNVLETMLGNVWLIFEPLMDMILYYFIVVIIFQRGEAYGVNPFIFIMLGIVHFRFLQKAIIMGGNSLTANQLILKQLIIEPLVFVSISFYQAILDFRTALAIYLILFFIIHGQVSAHIIYYPFIIFLLFLLAWFFGVIFGSLTVFFRDLPIIANFMLRLLLYGSAIFYPITFVPERYREAFLYNPIACVFGLIQWSLLNTPAPPLPQIVSLICFATALFLACHFLYNTVKVKFTKVL